MFSDGKRNKRINNRIKREENERGEGLGKNCKDMAYIHSNTRILAVAFIIPVTSGEEWQNKSFIRVLYCIPDDYMKFLSCKCPWPPPALK